MRPVSVPPNALNAAPFFAATSCGAPVIARWVRAIEVLCVERRRRALSSTAWKIVRAIRPIRAAELQPG